MTEFVGGDVWERIGPLVRSCRRRKRVAVAYLGASAPEILPLRKNDLLIVAATTANAKAGAINPESLQHYIDAGVKVFAHKDLHAKVFRLGDTTIIGSANASRTSTFLEEGVLITTTASVARQVDSFLDDLEADSYEVDDHLLASLRQAWEKRVRGGSPGVSGPRDNKQWPPTDARLFVYDSIEVNWSAAATATLAQVRREWRRKAGTNWVSSDPLQGEMAELSSFREGDLILFRQVYDNDETWVYPPAEVLGEAVRISSSRNGFLPLRYPNWLDAKPLKEFNEQLRQKTGKTLGQPRQVRSHDMVHAILGIFDLPGSPK